MKAGKVFKVKFEEGVLKPLEPLTGLETGTVYSAMIFYPVEGALSYTSPQSQAEEFSFQRFRGVLPDNGDDEELLVKVGFSET